MKETLVIELSKVNAPKEGEPEYKMLAGAVSTEYTITLEEFDEYLPDWGPDCD